MLQEIQTYMDDNKDEYKLNKKQQKAYNAFLKGENIFLTGSAGVGKSFLIQIFQKETKFNRNIALTSTTGISALQIGGSTVHSYLGLGLGKKSVDELVKKIKQRNYLRQRWISLDTLIIDEVSMLGPVLFDKIENIARGVRGNNKPFGGIQMVLTGDFLQLPVVKSDKFCFESKSWKHINKVIHLTEIVRQTNKEFQTALNEIRVGKLSDKTIKLLKSRENVKLKHSSNIKPTRMFTTNADVDIINQRELDKLNTGENDFYEYEMEFTSFKFNSNMGWLKDKYVKNCTAPDRLELCIDAQVMLLHNLDVENGLANGSRGVVVDFIEDKPIVLFMNGVKRIIDYHNWEFEEGNKKVFQITQIPLKLAWACSVHKGQGSTLDFVKVYLDNVFEYGQAYVALSRVKTLDGLAIRGLNISKIKAHPKALDFYKNLK